MAWKWRCLQAPMFQMDFFDSMVGHTLYNAYAGKSGWPCIVPRTCTSESPAQGAARQVLAVTSRFGSVFLLMLQGVFQFLRSCVHVPPAGTALDYVWPYLLRYPPDEIGIIDAVCVSHIDWGAIRQMVLPRYPTWAPYG